MVQPDGTPADGEAVERELGDAIASVLSRHEQSITTRWVALVETMNGDGQRGLWTFASDDVTEWDTIGLLTHGLHLQQAATVVAALNRE
jgi:hypothetical protein